jgi:hypothetical protein
MAENALKILASKDSLQKFRDGALEVANQFDLEKILPLYINLYKKVIGA